MQLLISLNPCILKKWRQLSEQRLKKETEAGSEEISMGGFSNKFL
jgi:hypothetical protein